MTVHKTCPICHKPEHPDFSPFCSNTCKNRDLISWLSDAYRIPVEETPFPEEEEYERSHEEKEKH